MTAKEYLSQIRLLDVKIGQRIKEYNELEAAEQFIGKAGRFEALKKDVRRIIAAHEAEKADIEKVIRSVPDERYRRVLWLRYVPGKNGRCKTLDEIAEEMNYCFEHTARLHTDALRYIDTVLIPKNQADAEKAVKKA